VITAELELTKKGCESDGAVPTGAASGSIKKERQTSANSPKISTWEGGGSARIVCADASPAHFKTAARSTGGPVVLPG